MRSITLTRGHWQGQDNDEFFIKPLHRHLKGQYLRISDTQMISMRWWIEHNLEYNMFIVRFVLYVPMFWWICHHHSIWNTNLAWITSNGFVVVISCRDLDLSSWTFKSPIGMCNFRWYYLIIHCDIQHRWILSLRQVCIVKIKYARGKYGNFNLVTGEKSEKNVFSNMIRTTTVWWFTMFRDG